MTTAIVASYIGVSAAVFAWSTYFAGTRGRGDTALFFAVLTTAGVNAFVQVVS